MKNTKSELFKLKNVGPATYKDLIKLGIHSIAELAKADPDELYERIQKITHQKHDPCVWDVFAAIIHEAKTGIRQPWWEWSKIRKNRKREGSCSQSEQGKEAEVFPEINKGNEDTKVGIAKECSEPFVLMKFSHTYAGSSSKIARKRPVEETEEERLRKQFKK